jgi:hypothetical protein
MKHSVKIVLAAVLVLAMLSSPAWAGIQNAYKFKSKRYEITTDVDRELAQDIAQHMDAVYDEYARRMSGFRPRTNDKYFPLYVWENYETYLEFVAGYGFRADNSGGVFFFSPKGSGLSTWVEGQSRLKMYYVLQHEGFHQFAYMRIDDDLPPWVNEGLAEYFGDALLIDGKLVPGKLDEERLLRMSRALNEHKFIDFRDLMTMDNREWVRRVTSGDRSMSQMYDMAWAVCYWLIHYRDGKYRGALEQYLGFLNSGRDSDQAFAQVFGKDLNNFKDAFEKGLPKLDPDPWFTSVRRVQFYAEVLKALHAARKEGKAVPEFKDFGKLREFVIRSGIGVRIEERDIVKRDDRDVKLGNESEELSFPKPGVAELVKSEDENLPDGLVVTGLKPTTIRLSWKLDKKGNLVEEISYEKTTRRKPAVPQKTSPPKAS